MGYLDGFVPIDRDSVRAGGNRSSLCSSRNVLQEFLDSGESALGKDMPPAELSRVAYNLRNYCKRHAEEFGNVGISTRGGKLILFRKD